MKRIFIVFFVFFLFLNVQANYPPLFWEKGRRIGLNIGYKHLSLNSGRFETGFIELSCFMNPTLAWEFTSKLEYGNNYLSFSPSGLIGLPFWIYSSSHGGDRDTNLFGALLSVASAKLPIKACDWLEITPYWDLLKISKLYKSKKFMINGDVGMQIKIYPFCSCENMSTFFVSGFCLYNFAYKKSSTDYMYEPWAYQIKNYEKSPFYGYSLGTTVGCYF